MHDINVFNVSSAKPLPRKKIIDALLKTFKSEEAGEARVNVIFMNDDEIHEMNKKYLDHDYPTDVLSFPLHDEIVEGEIYISVDTARIQAEEYGVSLTNELRRLAVHGALHLIGYEDADEESRRRMHELENKYIA